MSQSDSGFNMGQSARLAARAKRPKMPEDNTVEQFAGVGEAEATDKRPLRAVPKVAKGKREIPEGLGRVLAPPSARVGVERLPAERVQAYIPVVLRVWLETEAQARGMTLASWCSCLLLKGQTELAESPRPDAYAQMEDDVVRRAARR
jgi:hypothetical protein